MPVEISEKKKDKKKVLITIISNRGYFPKHFSLSLIELVNNTRKEHNIELINVSSCDVNYMRNRACLIAQNKGKEARGFRFDYIVMLDDDHIYSPNFINKFISYNLPVVVGCTSQRTPPYKQTQYKELKGIGFKEEDNLVKPNKNDGLIKIGVTGPVGMCINVDVLDKLKFPYFEQIILNDGPEIRGGDVNFCYKLNDAGIPIYLDSSESFPHCTGESLYVDRGEVKYHP